jgi:hypothetical protein
MLPKLMSRLKVNHWRAECIGNLHAPFWEGCLEKCCLRTVTRWSPTLQHAPCGTGEKLEITSNAYLLLPILEEHASDGSSFLIAPFVLIIAIVGILYPLDLLKKEETKC